MSAYMVSILDRLDTAAIIGWVLSAGILHLWYCITYTKSGSDRTEDEHDRHVANVVAIVALVVIIICTACIILLPSHKYFEILYQQAQGVQ